MGIYQSLVEPLGLDPVAERRLFAAVQGKSETDIAELLGGHPGAGRLTRLPTLMGRADILAEARQVLDGAPAGVAQALDALAMLADLVADLVAGQGPDIDLRFDLAELAGYGYHNGPVFSAYHAGRGSAVARGGRYDGIGAAFGRARPATGFDVNLKQLLDAGQDAEPAIWVPFLARAPERPDWPQQSAEMSARIRALRTAGEVVVAALSADEPPPARCDRVLTLAGGSWSVVPLKQ
jgi:ATP phosphoribosyltransferase regulatory subunit